MGLDRRLWRRAVAAAALLSAPCPAFAQETVGAGFDVLRYTLAITPDIATGTVAGREDIRLRATADGVARVTFSANELAIDQATVDGVDLRHALAGDALTFELPKPLRKGRVVTLRIAYHGLPRRGLTKADGGLYTSYFACDWMICPQTAFGDKAEVSLDLSVPAGLQTLSVGRHVSATRAGNGREVHRWRSPRAYSPYLYGFAVGHFTVVREGAGRSTLTYASAVADADELRRRFADTRDMVAFLSAKAGLPLPVSDYTQLLVTGGEAQEAATYSVLGTKAAPATPGDAGADWAIVHELAHQWWGNLVTCDTLQHFWLNEGITTFMTAAWKEHRYGRAAYDAELDVARTRLERARRDGYDKPLAWSGTYPSLGLRRAVQYSKGALFMAHLRDLLGERAFWAGLRGYTRAHAGGTVTSRGLQRAMEAASGRRLDAEFAQWVFGSQQ